MVASHTLAPGDPAPDFALQSGEGEEVRLSGLRGRWVVIYFYPADDTPGCTAESCAFRDHHDDFVEAGATVLGVSSDSVDSHKSFAAKHDLPFSLLSDPDGEVRKQWGVRKTLGLLPGRVTFVLDAEGVVRHVFSSQFRASAHQAEALAAVRGQRT